jgi:hypothetical protein
MKRTATGGFIEMNATDRQRYHVAKLIGCCEGIIASRVLGPTQDAQLRKLVANALDEFGMPHCAYDSNLEAVRSAMEEA